ncbi:MAG: S-layer homology domain-containing protein [Candidatus Sericytochromatia bacterium]|nr:S-layer homology domain-containing protein [Candidatus Sericytochromatia bacterium]
MSAADLYDLPSDHWAFQAIQQLTERYGVMQGFPDNTFRGNKTVSRYELAAALTRVMQRMQMASQTTNAPLAQAGNVTPARPQDPTQADKELVERLGTEFRKELQDIQDRLKKGEDNLKGLQDKLTKMVTIKGQIDTVLGDETLDIGKDRTAPFIGSNLSMMFKGQISEQTTYDASLAGALKAAGSGDVPAIMAGALGRTPTNDTVSLRSARVTSKIGGTTINVGRFPLWLVGLGGYSDQAFHHWDFAVGAGIISPDASTLRVGSDVGIAVQAPVGPVSVAGALNSNILVAQVEGTWGIFGLKAGFETDHKAITQEFMTPGQRVKTTYNTVALVDVGGEGPVGGTLQLNVTNDALTQFGGGIRGTWNNIDLNGILTSSSDPGRSVDVLSYSAIACFPKYSLFGDRFTMPVTKFALVDNYTWNAPLRSDRQETTGPGGLALGKNAGLSIQVVLDNPFIPGLLLEYNAQAKLIENIFIPNAQDPITSESVLMKSTLRF